MSMMSQSRLDAALAGMAAHGAPVGPAVTAAAFTKGFDLDAIRGARSLSELATQSPGRRGQPMIPVGKPLSSIWEALSTAGGVLSLFDQLAGGSPNGSTTDAFNDQCEHEREVERARCAEASALDALERVNDACIVTVVAIAEKMQGAAKAALSVLGVSAGPLISAMGLAAVTSVTGLLSMRNSAMSGLLSKLLVDMAPPADPGCSDDPVCKNPRPECGEEPNKPDEPKQECPKQNPDVEEPGTPAPQQPQPQQHGQLQQQGHSQGQQQEQQQEQPKCPDTSPPQTVPSQSTPSQSAPSQGAMVNPSSSCPPPSPPGAGVVQSLVGEISAGVTAGISAGITAGIEAAAGTWNEAVTTVEQAVQHSVPAGECPQTPACPEQPPVEECVPSAVADECPPEPGPETEPEPESPQECPPETPETPANPAVPPEEPPAEPPAESSAEPPAPETYHGFDKTQHPSYPGVTTAGEGPADQAPIPEPPQGGGDDVWTPDIWVGASASASVEWSASTIPTAEASTAGAGGVDVARSDRW